VQEVDDDGDLHVVAACLGADSFDLVAVAVDQGDPVAAGGVAASGFVDDLGDDFGGVPDAGGQPLALGLAGGVCGRAIGRVGPSRRPGIAALV
jgi:hypothetical protein